jgi:putative acetyltransferase
MARITDQELRAPPSRLAGKRRFDRQRAMDYPIAMITIRSSRPGEGARVVEIWRRAVDATHDFLSPEDRQAIDEMVCGFLPQAPLLLAVDAHDYPQAFMLIDNGHMQALFVDPACRGTGIGAALVRHGLALHPRMTTDVNEQNGQAVGFYERMGFKRIGRSALDDQGRPYPLIRLAYQA